VSTATIRWDRYVTERPMQDGDPDDEAVPLNSMVEQHRIAFLVTDPKNRPLAGKGYVLRHRGKELERAELPKDGVVRREDVDDDDYQLELVDVSALAWRVPATDAGTAVALEVRVTGVADGTALEVRLFEELREAKDQALLTTKIELQGGTAKLEWTPEVDLQAVLPPAPGILHVIAEVRLPDGTWAKTDTPLRVRLPTILEVAWSKPHAATDEELELIVVTQGLPDGTNVEFDVWRRGLTGQSTHLGTVAEMPIHAGRAVARWRYAEEGDDDAPADAECWFSATTVDPVECSAASAAVWLRAPA
jgi:hypothetical protein